MFVVFIMGNITWNHYIDFILECISVSEYIYIFCIPIPYAQEYTRNGRMYIRADTWSWPGSVYNKTIQIRVCPGSNYSVDLTDIKYILLN